MTRRNVNNNKYTQRRMQQTSKYKLKIQLS